MNVKTSFFNKSIFISTLKKTLPYCIAVSVICFLFCFYSMKDFLSDGFYWDITSESVTDKQIINFCIYQFATSAFCKFAMIVYSFLISVVAFGYLYSQKLCKTIHALPVTRTSMYISNVLAGFAAIIIPYIIATITAGIYSVCNGHSFFCAFAALGIDICFSLIFYSIGILSVMFTGHILSTPVMFIFLNFGFFSIENLILVLTHMMLFGLGNMSNFGHLIFTPIIYLCAYLTPDFSKAQLPFDKFALDEKVIIAFAAYTVIAILLLVVSGILYKIKKLENQGDPITIKKTQPFFHYCSTIISGSVLAIVLYGVFAIANDLAYFSFSVKLLFLVLFIISSLICFYIFKMLFNKTIRVFKSINWGIFVYIAVSIVTFIIFAFDLAGIERNIPKNDAVSNAKMSVEGHLINTSNEETINKILAIHGDIIDNKEEIIKTANNYDYEAYEAAGYYSDISIEYTKKNGSKIERYYTIIHDGENQSQELQEIYDSAKDIVNSSEAVYSTLKDAAYVQDINIYDTQKYDVANENPPEPEEAYDENSNSAESDVNEPSNWYVSEEYNDNFQKALLEDAKSGNLLYYTNDDEISKYYISVFIIENGSENYVEYQITDKCTNTLKVIDEVIKNYNKDNDENEEY